MEPSLDELHERETLTAAIIANMRVIREDRVKTQRKKAA